VYLLERGLVRIFRTSRSGAETTFGYVRPGEIFGELAVFSSRPRESFAVAARASLVWRLRRDAIRAVLAAHAGIVLAVTKQVGSRLKRIESRVEHLVFRPVHSRVAGILLELAEEFGRPNAHGLVVDLSLSQEELATLVGASRQAVNASLRELERAKMIRRDGRRFALLAIDALRRSRDAVRRD
jgi:CRP-like cAMP-binding protein